MDFTREPIIETVITPKEGYKLVVRSSKGIGQEEYFVDAVEVVTFGNAIFLRSLEKPKAFIVPASDYEVLEVREARMVLKNVGLDRSIKIAGGREAPKPQPQQPPKEAAVEEESGESAQGSGKRDRRRHQRRRRGREEIPVPQTVPQEAATEEKLPTPDQPQLAEGEATTAPNGAMMSRLLAPPPLISETIARYKEKFKDAFYTKEEQEANLGQEIPEAQSSPVEVPLEQPEFGSFELDEDAEEEIYRQRKRHYAGEGEQEAPEAPVTNDKESSET